MTATKATLVSALHRKCALMVQLRIYLLAGGKSNCNVLNISNLNQCVCKVPISKCGEWVQSTAYSVDIRLIKCMPGQTLRDILTRAVADWQWNR